MVCVRNLWKHVLKYHKYCDIVRLVLGKLLGVHPIVLGNVGTFYTFMETDFFTIFCCQIIKEISGKNVRLKFHICRPSIVWGLLIKKNWVKILSEIFSVPKFLGTKYFFLQTFFCPKLCWFKIMLNYINCFRCVSTSRFQKFCVFVCLSVPHSDVESQTLHLQA